MEMSGHTERSQPSGFYSPPSHSDWFRSQQVTQASPIKSLSQDPPTGCGNDRKASSYSEVDEIGSQPGLWGVKGGGAINLTINPSCLLKLPR